MTTAAMVDIETLSTQPNATVLTVGGVKFDPHCTREPHSDFYVRLNVDHQISSGRHVDPGTLEWWSKQDPEIQQEALGDENRVDLLEFMQEFNRWCATVDEIWCQGPQFDMVIIENLYAQLNHHTSWPYWKIRDCRTVFSMMPKDPRKDIQQDLHNALADSRYQAIALQRSYKHFGVTSR